MPTERRAEGGHRLSSAEKTRRVVDETTGEVLEVPEGQPDAAEEEVAHKRRMPENLRRHMIRMQGGKMYLPAAMRIVWFRDELGDGWGVQTRLIEGGHERGFATVHAEITNPEGRVVASGMKTESKQDFPAGWVEKAESGSISRALAVLGFGTQFDETLVPADETHRPTDSPQPLRGAHPASGSRVEGSGSATEPPTLKPETWPGPGQCPTCHAPEGKRHGKACLQ